MDILITPNIMATMAIMGAEEDFITVMVNDMNFRADNSRAVEEAVSQERVNPTAVEEAVRHMEVAEAANPTAAVLDMDENERQEIKLSMRGWEPIYPFAA
jgi:hypothetical protein